MNRLELSDLHDYQVRAIRFLIDHPYAALWLDMGLGKTAVTLCALRDLIDRLQVFGVLIVAPLRVCQAVWRQEAAKWSYTSDMSFTLIHGPPEKRRRLLRQRSMIYMTNYENLRWLAQEVEDVWLSKGMYPPFDCIVMDEISRVKNARVRQGSGRGKAVLKLLPYLRRRVGLTGTPMGKGLLSLFGQYLCLDSGATLGTSYDAYKRQYFYQTDWNGYRFAPFAHSQNEIRDLVSGITLSMRNEEYLNLPDLMVNDVYVDLPDDVRATYQKMEAEFLLEFKNGATLELSNEAAKIGRCLQVAGGACYLAPGEPEWGPFHDAKMLALEEVVEEAAGAPVLVTYQFQHEAHRILKKYPGAKWIGSHLSESQMLQTQTEWNEGKLSLLIGHPQSLGHGLNLQAGGSTLVWFGLNWSYELYAQTIARLRRQGQESCVVVHRILSRNTFDDVQRISLREQEKAERAMRDAIEEVQGSPTASALPQVTEHSAAHQAFAEYFSSKEKGLSARLH